MENLLFCLKIEETRLLVKSERVDLNCFKMVFTGVCFANLLFQ